MYENATSWSVKTQKQKNNRLPLPRQTTQFRDHADFTAEELFFFKLCAAKHHASCRCVGVTVKTGFSKSVCVGKTALS